MGFFYHSKELNGSKILKKCAERLDKAPNKLKEVSVTERDAVLVEDLINSAFTTEWKTANFTDGGAVQIDTPYPDLNEQSRQKEQEHLREKRGQFFYVIGEVVGVEETATVSALAEIRGRASREKVEYFIEEYQVGEVAPVD